MSMKNKKLTLGFMFLGGLALALPAIACAPKNVEPAEVLDDPVVYEEDDETVVRLANPLRVVQDRAEEEVASPDKVILHYHNDDQACRTRRFYTWVTGVDGVERKPRESDWTGTDMAIELDLKNDIPEYQGLPELYFIIKVAGTWSGQSEDTILNYADYTIENGVLEVWTIPAEGTSIDIFNTEEESKLPKITTAKFTDWKTIHCTSTVEKGIHYKPNSYKLYAFDKGYLTSTESAQKANKEFYLFKQGVPESDEFDIKFNFTAKINIQYVIESWFPGYEDRTQKIIVSCENLYSTARFEQFYTYDAKDLGVTVSSDEVTFKVWSPISALVSVNIYDNGSPKSLDPKGSDACSSYAMSYQKGGVWVAKFVGEDAQELIGKYYTYTVIHSNGSIESVDPYAKAAGINGARGFIYDKNASSANPNGWDSVPAKWDGVTGYDIATPQDLSIYEIHVRDLTMDSTWGGKEQPGTFKAFAEKGTTYSERFNGTGYTVKTGYDHIEELGVNAIQLLPVFDHDDDERTGKMKFNWGYNPLNYNCVEGGYSSDPYDPLARIVEYKDLIKAYSENANHTRVIMDVVYNHVSSAPNSCFTKIMPKYYFRYNSEWVYEDGSGCSNEVRTEATMMRKYIVDSLCWWASEYKIKGFRFDLMGLIDVETLRQARVALNAIDPDIYIYGEGWQSVAGYHGKGVDCADSEHVYSKLYPAAAGGYVGAFNDEGRNAARGGNDHGWGTNNSYPYWGWISQGSGDVGSKSDTVKDMLLGFHTNKGNNPGQSISYVSCHDNYTAYDQIRYSLATGYKTGSTKTSYKYNMNDVPTGAPNPGDVVNASIAVHATTLMSNGVAFIQGGEEIYRTKTISPIDNAAQGIKATPEYAELTTDSEAGAHDAIVRPFPDYPTYVPENNPGDASYNPNYPVIPLATGEVRAVGTEIVSHNSYKLPDSVNSFKWDRKIHIGDTLTYNNIGTWSNLVKARNETKKVEGNNIDSNYVSIWNTGEGSSLIAGWFRVNGSEGFALFIGGRSGGQLTWGGFSEKALVASNGLVSHVGDNVSAKAFGFALYRING